MRRTWLDDRELQTTLDAVLMLAYTQRLCLTSDFIAAMETSPASRASVKWALAEAAKRGLLRRTELGVYEVVDALDPVPLVFA